MYNASVVNLLTCEALRIDYDSSWAIKACWVLASNKKNNSNSKQSP